MKLISTDEAGKILGVSSRRIRQLIAEGKLAAQKVGRDYAIEQQALGSVRTYGKPGRPSKKLNARQKIQHKEKDRSK